jgi:hypothetical protein
MADLNVNLVVVVGVVIVTVVAVLSADFGDNYGSGYS